MSCNKIQFFEEKCNKYCIWEISGHFLNFVFRFSLFLLPFKVQFEEVRHIKFVRNIYNSIKVSILDFFIMWFHGKDYCRFISNKQNYNCNRSMIVLIQMIYIWLTMQKSICRMYFHWNMNNLSSYFANDIFQQ